MTDHQRACLQVLLEQKEGHRTANRLRDCKLTCQRAKGKTTIPPRVRTGTISGAKRQNSGKILYPLPVLAKMQQTVQAFIGIFGHEYMPLAYANKVCNQVLLHEWEANNMTKPTMTKNGPRYNGPSYDAVQQPFLEKASSRLLRVQDFASRTLTPNDAEISEN